MSQTEQKFDSLCTLTLKHKSAVALSFDGSTNRMQISLGGKDIDYTTDYVDPDQALTDALRHLRKIKTKQS